MKQVKQGYWEPDMVLAEAVFGRNAELLMPAGAKLTDNSIKLLELRHVSSIFIEGEAEDILARYPPEAVTEERNHIQSKFLTNPSENTLFSEVVQFCIERELRNRFPQLDTPPPATEQPEGDASANTPSPTQAA